MTNKIKDNFLNIKKITDGYNAKIVAVSKYYAADKMVEAYTAGIRNFGESKLPDAVKKINSLDDKMNSDCSYHLIGHLQTNKVKWAAGFFKLIHSVDSIRLADEISKKALELGVKQEILIQVNNSGEEQKSGIALSQLENMMKAVSLMEGVEVKGFMNIAPLTDDTKLINRLFSEMHKLKETYGLKELSMGMSNDFKIALDNGATIVRLGRILFE